MSRGCILFGAETLEEIDEGEVRLERLGSEAREVGAEVIRVIEPHVPGDAAGEESLPEGSPGDQSDPELLADLELRGSGPPASTVSSGPG